MTKTDTDSAERLAAWQDDFGDPGVARFIRVLAAERDTLRAESVNYADALAAQNNVIDGLMAENARLREALTLISHHRETCHTYDDDMSYPRRTFDVEDVRLMEFAARNALKGGDHD